MSWIVSAIALIGVWLNIRKDNRCFILWAFTNGYWCIYDYTLGAIAQSALFLVYFILALYGLWVWTYKKGS
jgi:hypothetical protein